MNKLKRFSKSILVILSLMCTISMYAQSTKISGVIMDVSGETIIGANIKIKGTNTGTISNIDGFFSLLVSPRDILVVSYMGYHTQEVSINNRMKINIVLQVNSQTLDEIVVVGYGSVKKSNLTTAVSKIGADAIKSRPFSTLSEAFIGQVAGVQAQISSGVPGEDLQITIRGNNSINSASTPLYIIDGIICETMSDISPNDVESIQVLKDAASTAIYGARGSNGVVLIETKQGKKGKISINLESYYAFQSPDRLPQTMSPTEWMAFNIYCINAAYLNRGGGNSMSIPNKLRPSGDQIPEQWLIDPQSDVADWRFAPIQNGSNFIKDVLRNAPVQNYQLSVSGRNDLGSIFFSGGYFNQEGIVRGTGFDRITFRANATMNASKQITFGVNVAPSFSTQRRGETEGKDKVIQTAMQYPPTMPSDKGTRDLGYWDVQPSWINPVERLKSVTDDMQINRVNSSLWGEYKIIPGLTFKSIFNYNIRTSIYEYFLPANVAPTTAQYSSGRSYSESSRTWGVQNTLSYEKTFAKKHNINVLIGQSADNNEIYRIDAGARDFPLESVSTLNLATLVTSGKTVRYMARTASFFGRLSYDFADRYLFSASIRNDGSSRFGPKNRWGLFPSVSGGWKINEEAFMKDIRVVNLLKIRASWGMSGNDRIGYNDYLSTFAITSGAWNGAAQGGMYPNNFANQDLKWESTEALDIGFDLSLLSNRIQLNFDYYINRTRDMLYNLNIPASTGFPNMRTNLATLENRGWELDINTVNINNKNFKWTSALNFSRNSNTILYMGGDDNIINEAWGAQFITSVGHPVSRFMAYKTDGVLTADDFGVGPDGRPDKTQPLVPIWSNQKVGNVKFVDTNKDGKITVDDQTPMGDNIPDLIFGFTNRFTYKGFDLSIFLQGQFGGDIFYVAARALSRGQSNYNQLANWLNGYKDEYRGGDPIPHSLGVDMGWDGVTPEARSAGGQNGEGDNANTHTDLRIYSATYLRIRNINLGYNFPDKWLKKTPIRAAKIYLTVENPFTFTKYPGNPDTNSYNPNNPMIRGADYSMYPLTKKYTVGFNVTF